MRIDEQQRIESPMPLSLAETADTLMQNISETAIRAAPWCNNMKTNQTITGVGNNRSNAVAGNFGDHGQIKDTKVPKTSKKQLAEV